MKRMTRERSVLTAGLLILVMLLSVGSGIYAGASFLAPLVNVTVTTTIFTTKLVYSTVLSTITQTVQGVLTTIQYTSSTSTVTVTGATSTRIGKVVTAFGNARIRTAQSVFGGASGSFDGTNSYLNVPDSADWTFGTGDFTIDLRVRFNALPASGNSMVLVAQTQDGNNFWWLFVDNSSGTYRLQFNQYSGGSYTVTNYGNTSPNLAINTWYHFAIVRSGNSWRLFQSGTQIGSTGASTASMTDFTSTLLIGEMGGGSYLNGWIDELRITKGLARWTSNFTPPTSAYSSDSNTVLLLHMDGPDGSTTFTDSTS